ncbi:MAG: M28 family peptidase [Bacteroidales bacterium]|nr:M28 family peptidase [Bacteroidales bacterium]
MKAQKDRLFKDVAFLTGVHPSRSWKNLETLEKVSYYIKKEFEKAGMQTEDQKWIAKRREYKNIIASYNSDKLIRLIVGAHYDVAGDQPGADDNASGVAGLLETARLLMEEKPELDYGIDFVAFCLEEPPFFGEETMGSYIHAESLFKKMTPVIGMICYEMLGYFSDEPGSQRYEEPEIAGLAGLYPDTADFIIVVGIEKHKSFNEKFHRLMSAGSEIDVQVISLPESSRYAELSDQRNYWPFGYKAVMINDTSFIRNPNYHRGTDTIDTLDFDKMTEVVNSAYRAIKGLG